MHNKSVLTFFFALLGAGLIYNSALAINLPDLQPGTSTEVILDASGSMKAKLDGKAKLVQAKRVIRAYLLEANKENVRLGFRVYGLRERDCKKTDLVLDFGQSSLDKIHRALDRVDPQGYGKTPLALALEMAAQDLAKQPAPRSVVVITDGLDTCGGDPCKVAAEIKKNLDVKIFVVGYAITPEEQKRLQCLADLSGGKNLTASDLASLLNSLKQTQEDTTKNLFVKSPDPLALVQVYQRRTDGKKVFVETFAAELGTRLPPGDYDVIVQLRKPYRFDHVVLAPKEKRTLIVRGDGTVHVKFLKKAMRVQVQNELGAEVLESTTDTDIRVPTGNYKLKVYMPPFAAADIDDVAVYPDDVTEERMEQFGLLLPKVPPQVSPLPLGYYIFDPKKNADIGSYVTGTPVVLPVGTYVLKTGHGIVTDSIEVKSARESTAELR